MNWFQRKWMKFTAQCIMCHRRPEYTAGDRPLPFCSMHLALMQAVGEVE